MLVFCNASKRKLWFTFWRGDVLTALPQRTRRCSVSTVRVQALSSPLGFGGAGFRASVIVFPIIALQGRQIAFERPCCHPRTSRRELSGEVRNCHLKPSSRSSDSLNDLLNSSSQSIASSSDFIEDSALLKASRVVELVSEGSDGFQLLNVLLKPSRRCIVTLYQATLGTCKGVSPLTPALVRSRRRSRPSGHRRERRTEGLRPSEPPPKGANSPLLKPPFCHPSHVTVFLGRS